MMKTYIALSTVLFLALCLLTGCPVQESKDKVKDYDTELSNEIQNKHIGPRIEFEETEHDFGNVPQKSKFKHIFKFKNSGTEKLLSEDVRSACGCIATKPDKTEYLPGEEGTVTVTFDTGSYKKAKKQSVTVKTNDPYDPIVHLYIGAWVVSFVNYEPEHITFEIMMGDQGTFSIKFFPNYVEAFEILGVSCTPDFITGEAKPFEREGKTAYEVIFMVDTAGAQVKHYNGEVQIGTDIEKLPLISIPVNCTVTGFLTVKPEFIDTIKHARDDYFIEYIQIRSSIPFTIKKYINNDNRIRVNLTEVKPQMFYILTVYSESLIPDKTLKDEITLYTDSKYQPVIKIPVKVYCK